MTHISCYDDMRPHVVESQVGKGVDFADFEASAQAVKDNGIVRCRGFLLSEAVYKELAKWLDVPFLYTEKLT